MKTKLIILFTLISLMGYSQGFYKRQIDPQGSFLKDTTGVDTNHYSVMVAPNGVYSLNWRIEKEHRYEYIYPVYGWWWAESEEQALSLLNLHTDLGLTAYYSGFQVYIDTVNKISTIHFMKNWILNKIAEKAPKYSIISGSNVTTTGQSLTDITGLSEPLEAGGIYEFETVLSVGTSSVNTGTKYGINYSQSGATVEAQIIGTRVANTTASERINAFNTPTTQTYLAASGINGQVLIKGIIKAGVNSGNLTIQHLKVTSGTSTVYIGSYLKVTKIN